jgi:hypothetical protein
MKRTIGTKPGSMSLGVAMSVEGRTKLFNFPGTFLGNE